MLGPKNFIRALAASGSYLDGGANVPFQEYAVSLINDTGKVRAEMAVLQRHFMSKRDYVVGRLKDMGFEFHKVPEATFYVS